MAGCRIQKNEYVNQHVVDEQIKKKEKLKVPYDLGLTLQLFSADNNVPGVHSVLCSLSEDMEAANMSISFRTINHVRRLHWSLRCIRSRNWCSMIPLHN